jgi:hypothetical protein
MLVYFMDIWSIFVNLVYFSPFWYVAPRKIWQQCFARLPLRLRKKVKTILYVKILVAVVRVKNVAHVIKLVAVVLVTNVVRVTKLVAVVWVTKLVAGVGLLDHVSRGSIEFVFKWLKKYSFPSPITF